MLLDAPLGQMIWCVEKRNASYGDIKGDSPWLVREARAKLGRNDAHVTITSGHVTSGHGGTERKTW